MQIHSRPHMFTMFTSKSVEFRSSDLRRNVLTILTLVQFLNLSAFRRSLVLFPVDIKAANLKSHPLSHSNKTFETSNLNIDKPYNWYNNSYILYNLSISIYIYIIQPTTIKKSTCKSKRWILLGLQLHK